MDMNEVRNRNGICDVHLFPAVKIDDTGTFEFRGSVLVRIH